jgi:hypothetical protein
MWQPELLIPYHKARSEMKNGDLVEFSSHSLIGNAIKYFTNKDVNHSALLFHVEEFKDIKDRKFLMEALADGIELNLFSLRLRGYKGKVYWYPLKDEYDHLRDKIACLALLAEGRVDEIAYDYLSLFKNMWKKVSVDVEKNSFCSEFYQYVLQESGVIPKGKKAMRPGEFTKLGVHKERQLIYEWSGK